MLIDFYCTHALTDLANLLKNVVYSLKVSHVEHREL